ncbi:hypothetical protein tb265_48250 [Gemmatimonadetes bacterium T265]|nr:hypothetical protein tb265_48250 [Gemmatimonadetes bacterium T265]
MDPTCPRRAGGRRRTALLAAGLTLGLVARAPGARAQDSIPAGPRSPAVLVLPIYDGAVTANASGGLRRRTAYVGALSVTARFDGARLAGVPGLSAFVYALDTHGGQPSDFVGDAQGVNNLTAPPALRLEEAWLQQNLFRDHLSILAGRYDLNTEFYRVVSATVLLNSSFGIGPEFSGSGRLGPSIYPRTAVGARLAYKPTRNSVVRAAVLDGVPIDRADGSVRLFAPGDGALLVAEAALLSRPEVEGPRLNPRFRIGRGRPPLPYDGKLAVGVWHYTARFDDLLDTLSTGAPVRHQGSTGVYAVGERTVWNAPRDSARALTVFGQAGVGDSRENKVGRYAGGGLALTAPFAGRDADVAGFGVAAAFTGGPFRAVQRATGAPAARAEVAVELTYLAQVTSWLVVQPDAQYVRSPGAVRGRPNATALSLRFEVAR